VLFLPDRSTLVRPRGAKNKAHNEQIALESCGQVAMSLWLQTGWYCPSAFRGGEEFTAGGLSELIVLPDAVETHQLTLC
jgi:hypothetical protein